MNATEKATTRAERILNDAALLGSVTIQTRFGEDLHIHTDWWGSDHEGATNPTYQFAITDKASPPHRKLLAPIEEFDMHDDAVKRLTRYLGALT